MTTVINTPPAATNSDSSTGPGIVIATILVLAALLVVFFMYLLPLIRNRQTQKTTPSTNINVQIPLTQPAQNSAN